jgi:plasmid rolling circle replication initiator protein Rep
MIEYISSYDDKKYGYIFITLTQRNVKGYELAGEIDTVIKAYHELMRITNVKDALEGSMRTLEVTYNEKDDTYHPHIHIFACVDEEKYFRRRKHSLYITNVDLRQYWRRSLRKVAGAERYPDSAVMSIKIQEVRNKYSDEQNADVSQYKAICEACKYPTKPIKWRAIPKEMRADVLSTIDGALKGRRLIGYMGVFKEAKNVLFKDDNVEGEKSDLNDYYTDVDVRTMVYVWRNGLYIPYKD